MTWLNPWAWTGLIAVALPILIHLLGRGPARIQRFPTLRFLNASRLLPTRRTRLHDLALLAVRAGILAAAAAALAQPLLLTANRRHALGDPLARAIIVDTSASMQRATPHGERAVVAARRVAAQLADSAQSSVVLESGAPAHAIAGAAAWLLTQPSRGEVAVVSDFQIGAIDAQDLSDVAPRFGIRLVRVDAVHDSIVETRTRVGTMDIVARATPLGNRTDVEWTAHPTAAGTPETSAVLLVGDREKSRLQAAVLAAATIGVADRGNARDTTRAIAIVYPEFSGRAAMLRGATIPALPWMTTIAARLIEDSMLVNAASNAVLTRGADSTSGIVIARTRNGNRAVSAVQHADQGRISLVLVSYADAGSLTSAALIAAVARAQAPSTEAAELEPSTLTSATLASLQRAPVAIAASQANAPDGPSDARWLWVVALLLLAAESWMRRVPVAHVA